MGQFSDSHRRLAALAEVASDDRVTQRSLALKLEISLGLANRLLRELERDGLVRVNAAAGADSPRYAITRAGRSAMKRLARAFAAAAGALVKKAQGCKAPPTRRRSARRTEAKRGR